MAVKKLLKAKWFWQDYDGTAWNNVEYANSGEEGLGSYVYPKGYKKPKSLFYHYQMTGIDESQYKLDNVKFILIIRAFKEKEHYFPTVKVFTGDNNAPYKEAPLMEVKTFTRLENQFDYDNYTLAYDLTGVTISQLKNLIVEVDWKNTKVSWQTTISVNRGRLEAYYSEKSPSWRAFDWVDKETVYDGEQVKWKISAKNGGYTGNGEIQLDLPVGATLVSSNGDGSFNSSTMKWTFKGDKNKQVSRYFNIRFDTVGATTLLVYNNLYPTNPTLYRDINVEKKVVPPKPTDKDEIYYTFYQTFAKEERQYFDVQINGKQVNHESGQSCYRIETSENVVLDTPLEYPNVYVLNESDDRVYGEVVGTDSDIFCLNVDETEDFEAHLRFFFTATSGDIGTVTITALNYSGGSTTGTFPILAPRKNIFVVENKTSRDTTYVQNSVNIGAENVWTIRAKSHRHNFFDERKDLFEIEIEEMIAYIGVVPLSRCHKADVTATSKNTLIENRYLNRAYYGKKGDYNEDIKMTLRIPWYDVATLQGLCEMDKPIPIDTIPYFPDGDPLNHRGWAEIYEVGNIKKINDFYYECDVGVTYLTHDILTKFTIAEAQKITEANIKFYLSLIHNYNDDILDLFHLNYYEFWTTLEDEYGDKTGSYNIEPNTSLIMSRDLNKYSTYDIIYRNTLPSLMSEDYDGNWEMALKVLNKNTREILFEHDYSNFKHYDFEKELAVNTANVNTQYLNGNHYDTLSFTKMDLGYDSLASSLERRKAKTHFNCSETVNIDVFGEKFEAFLLDDRNNGLSNKNVTIKIKGDNGYANTFNILTDVWGRIIFNPSLENGTYKVSMKLDEDGQYKGSKLIVEMIINLQLGYANYHFEYPRNKTILDLNYPYQVTLLDEEDNPVCDMMLHYSFKDLGDDNKYGYERTATTDIYGNVNIPMDWNNGSKMLKVVFKGFEFDGDVYNPVIMEDRIDFNITGKDLSIEADDLELVQGEATRDYNVIVKDEDGNAKANVPLDIAFFNSETSFVKRVVTNNYGVASTPINLTGDYWTVNVHFKGNSDYKPQVVTKTLGVLRWERLDTTITSSNLRINEDKVLDGEQGYYTIQLRDSYNNYIVSEPVRITVKSLADAELCSMVLRTDDLGRIEVPYLNHNVDVRMLVEYKGCARYNPQSLNNIVRFENISEKYSVSFTVDDDKLKIKHNNDSYEDIATATDTVERVIINYPNNDYKSFDGMVYYKCLNSGTFKVTLFYKGNDEYYSHTETLTYEKVSDDRVTLTAYSSMMGASRSSPTSTHKNSVVPTESNHFKFIFDYELPYEIMKVYSAHNYETPPFTLDMIPKYFVEDGVKKTYFEVDMPVIGAFNQVGNRWNWELRIGHIYDTSDFLVDTIIGFYMPLSNYSGVAPPPQILNTTITEDGFGDASATYQEMDVYVTGDNAESETRVSDYIAMRIYNPTTLEEFDFSSSMVDNVTPSHFEFLLDKSTWNMDIVSYGTPYWTGSIYQTSVTLTDDTQYVVNDDFFYSSENWNKIGSASSSLVISNDELNVTNYSSSTYFVSDSFTDTLQYKLSSTILISNVSNHYLRLMVGNSSEYYNDGLIITKSNCYLYQNNEQIENVRLPSNIADGDEITIERNINIWNVYVNNNLVYTTTVSLPNTFGLNLNNATVKNVKFYVPPVEDITPPVDEYDGSVFGSNLHLEVRDDHLNLIDYGMLPSGATGSGKVIVSDVPIPQTDLELEMEIKYNNTRFDRLQNLDGQMQMRVYEDVIQTDAVKEYSKVLCSPMVVRDVQTVFTRHSEEGILYYIKDPRQDGAEKPYYLCNAYNQYKGGVNIQSEQGVQLFDLDNAYSPVFVGNNLIRAEFHRRSGYIKLARWSEDGNMWYTVNILKLRNNPQLTLVEYNDDYCELTFGNTTWKFYRGRPFIVCNHEQDDLRMLKLVDRVYCETFENDRSMGFIEEHDAMSSTFTPQLSIQQFKQPLHIGEAILTDNFEVYSVDSNYDLQDPTASATLGVVDWNNENALLVQKNTNNKIALNFPSYANYVPRVDSTFSLLIANLMTDNETTITIKARGFDDRGAVPVTDDIQYGIWEQTKQITVQNCLTLLDGTTSTNDISDCESYLMKGNYAPNSYEPNYRVTFTDCPSEVKYIDFVMIFNSSEHSETSMKNLMYYQGDSIINHTNDTSLVNAEKVEVQFNETYYANLYNESDPFGLCIVRPYQHKFSLRTLYADKETVFIPYMKKATDWDSPNQVFLEYLNANRQVIDIDWEN